MVPPRSLTPLVALLAACTGGDDPSPRIDPPDPELVEVVWRGEGSTRDRGIGVVARTSAVPDALRPGAADTLAVFARPDRAAAMVGGFVVHRVGDHGWEYTLLTTEGDESNLLEFGYEEVGIPFVATTPDSAWARVVFAHAPDGTPRAGWVSLDQAGIERIGWSDWLVQYPVFLLPGNPGLHDRPGGELLEAARPPDDADYIMHIEDRFGDWVRVRMVSPTDYCFDPVDPEVRTGWVRYLTPAGRPAVWYFTRGC